MLRRDVYHDYVTAYEEADAPLPVSDILRSRTFALLERSGAGNVRSGRVHAYEALGPNAKCIRVTFASSSWTGRA